MLRARDEELAHKTRQLVTLEYQLAEKESEVRSCKEAAEEKQKQLGEKIFAINQAADARDAEVRKKVEMLDSLQRKLKESDESKKSTQEMMGRVEATASLGSVIKNGECSLPRKPAVWNAFRLSLSPPISRFCPISMKAGMSGFFGPNVRLINDPITRPSFA